MLPIPFVRTSMEHGLLSLGHEHDPLDVMM